MRDIKYEYMFQEHGTLTSICYRTLIGSTFRVTYLESSPIQVSRPGFPHSLSLPEE